MKEKIKIPKNLEVKVEGKWVEVKGEKEKAKKRFYHPKIKLKKSGDEIIISTKNDKKKLLAIENTWHSHIKNMFKGVQEGFEYKMEISHVHFPMSVEVKDDEVVIKNFLGQKSPKKAKILEGVEVKIKGAKITIKGADKEKVGQTAGNIENAATLRKKRDRRKFSDGIFITSKVK